MPLVFTDNGHMSFTIQTSFAGLKASKPVSDRVEQCCLTVQELCVRATHLANYAVIMPEYPADELYRFVEDTTWWRHCAMLWTIPAKKGPKPKYSHMLIQAKASLDAISSSRLIDASGMNSIITAASLSMQDAAKRMVKIRYSQLVKLSIRRKIILQMKLGKLPLTSKQRNCLQRWLNQYFFGFADESDKPSLPTGVLEALQTEIMRWKIPFEHLFCYHDRVKALNDVIEDVFTRLRDEHPDLGEPAVKKMAGDDAAVISAKEQLPVLWQKRQSDMILFQRFLHDLRREDVIVMDAMDASETTCISLHKETQKAFRNACKVGLLLPLSSYDVKSIRMDPTSLHELISSLPKDVRPVEKRGKKRTSLDEEKLDENLVDKKKKRGGNRKQTNWDETNAKHADFLEVFPGLMKVLKSNRGTQDVPKWFAGSLTTNGVSVSVLMDSGRKKAKVASPEDESTEASPKVALLQTLRPILVTGKRLVAVDPGMRDIVTAVAMDVNTQAALQKSDGVRVTMKTSNKQFTRSSWRKKTQLLTTNEQKRIDVDEEGLQRFKARLDPAKNGPKKVRLAEYLRLTPPKDCALDIYMTYLAYNWPVIMSRLQSFQSKSIRKAKFAGRSRTDAFLDKMCKDMISLGVSEAEQAIQKPKGSDVLVAFGDASTSSGGFGYGSAPQHRLRHRLQHVHNCHVCIIDEYLTSQMCSSCEQKLLFVGCKNSDDHEAAVRQSKASGCKPPMYGVLKCIHCKSPRGAEGKFPKRHWHRDINASVNIGKAYIYAARNQVEPNKPCPRPFYLARPIKE